MPEKSGTCCVVVLICPDDIAARQFESDLLRQEEGISVSHYRSLDRAQLHLSSFGLGLETDVLIFMGGELKSFFSELDVVIALRAARQGRRSAIFVVEPGQTLEGSAGSFTLPVGYEWGEELPRDKVIERIVGTIRRPLPPPPPGLVLTVA